MNILLYGGGLDSTALLLHMLHSGIAPEKIMLLHVDYGQKAVQAERAATDFWTARYGLAEPHFGRIDLSWSRATIMQGTDIGEASSNMLELRNPLLISYAACYAASHYTHTDLYLGFHQEPADSCFLDAQTDYLAPLLAGLNGATARNLRVCTPLSGYTRQRIFELGAALDTAFIDCTHTCYEPVTCGVCVHCKQKEAMVQLFQEAIA